MTDLVAGYAGALSPDGRKKLPGWQGVLRETPRSKVKWRCRHQHSTPPRARDCAEAELQRRKQGGKEVFWLQRCEPCNRWLADGPADACPVCGVPMERVKVAVLERVPVS